MTHAPKDNGFRQTKRASKQNFWKYVFGVLNFARRWVDAQFICPLRGFGCLRTRPAFIWDDFKLGMAEKLKVQSLSLLHRAFAPSLAIFTRLAFDILSARAFPPNLPNAAACGFLDSSECVSSFSPVASSTINFARALVSRGRCGFFMGRKIRNISR